MQNTLFRLLTLVILVSLIPGVGIVSSQDDGASQELPPKVIDVWPLPGVEMGGNEPLTITFDQVMVTTAVEQAFTITPPLEGALEWTDPRTVNFTPSESWGIGATYEVTIGTGAIAAANELPLEDPYTVDVLTVGPLEVAAIAPEDGTENVDANATIVVTFNRPVTPLVATDELDDLPDPITIEPAIEGTGEWVNTSIFVFTPKEIFAGGTTYTVTVKDDLVSIDGAPLAEPVSWTFSTLPPQVTNIYPYSGQSGLLLDATVRVDFSQSMDRASVETAFQLVNSSNLEPVVGSFEWDETSTYVTFTPDDMLDIETNYRINIEDTAKSAFGDATIGADISRDFSTVPYPGVASTRPENGERNVYPGYGASIYFRSPMKSNSLEDKIVIAPAPEEWVPFVGEEQTDYITLGFPSKPETTYTITLLAGAEDIYGNVIEEDYTFSYTTSQLPTSLSPITRGTFMLTGAHRNHTRFAIRYSGTPKADIRLYQVPVETIDTATLANRYYYETDRPSWVTSENLVDEWTLQFDSEDRNNALTDILLAGEEGGVLPLGVYWVDMDSTYTDGDQRIQTRNDQFAIAVVTATVTVKRTDEEMMVWVTDMVTTNPVPNAFVSVYHHDRLLARGETDADGIFRTPASVSPNDPFLMVEAETADAYGIYFSNSFSVPGTTQDYLYTDRPLYRPGETVYYKGTLRNKDDVDYSVPNQRSVSIKLENTSDGTILFEGELPLTEFGTFAGELALAEDVALGDVGVYVNDRWIGSFRIAEFRVPEYEVSVEAAQTEIVQGESLSAVINASYYFGGTVSNAAVYYYANGYGGSFNYTGPGRYSFYDATATFPSLYLSGEDKTDAAGNYLVQQEEVRIGTTRPMRIDIEGTVMDESNQPISGRTSVLVHPSNVYVGQLTDKAFGREGEEMTVELITVNPQSEIVPEHEVDLRLVEIRWTRELIEGQFGRYTWSQEEIEVLTDTIVTGEDGKATYTFTPPNGGIFRLRAETMDERERLNASTLQFYVIGDRPVWWGEPSGILDLVPDKTEYTPGDTAEILIPIPFAGKSTALITVERENIMFHEVVAVEGSTLLYQLPITDAFAPNSYFRVTLMKGVDEESLNPEYLTGSLNLSVVPVQKKLNVEVTPSKERAQPRDSVSFDVKVTDASGEPVQAEVGFTLTDKAILALAPPNSPTIQNAFYGTQYNYVYTSVALDSLLDVITDQNVEEPPAEEAAEDDRTEAGEAGYDFADGDAPAAAPTMEAALDEAGRGVGGNEAQQPEPPVIRENFEQTPLWEPTVVTGTDGSASVTVELPDNLTTWSLDVKALTVETRVGDAKDELLVTLPLLVRPATPRFLVVDDRVELAMVVNNNLEEAQEIEATLEYEGVTLDGPDTQTVTIEAGGRARVRWMATVNDVEGVDLTFTAIGSDFADAAKPSLANEDGLIPVYRYTAPDTVGTAGLIRNVGSRTEGIALPTRIPAEDGQLVIQIDPSLAATAIDSFDYLRNYKHQCIEQTVSRFLPNAVTYRALKSLDIEDPVLEANLVTALTEGLDILKRAQNPDGGWGWFAGMESSALVTSYAALGLIEAREAGFTVDQAMLSDALNFVRADLIRPTIDTSEWQLNRQAFYLYVMARDDKGDLQDYEDLMEHRLDMSYMGRAYLLMAYLELFPQNGAIDDLVSDLTSAAILSATGAHWEENWVDWWNWSSDTRTTAVVLSALIKATPESDLLANAVRWLMIARDGDHWTTTQETVWAVIGLTDWMMLTGELKGNYDYNVTLDRNLVGSGEVTPENVREGNRIEIPISELSTDELNRLVFARDEGEGVMYYTTHMNLRLPASEVDALSRGITVQREYFLNDDPEQPITGAAIGDTITVRLTITLSQDIYYFVLEDPIPAGTEAVDTSLLTTSRQVEGPTLRPDDYWHWDPFWYWGWWWFDHTELRDEQANLYADFLPRGTYTYTYQIQATTPGEFQTMPSHGYAFYMPDVFGRTKGSLFTIVDAQPEE
ncbi:MAG: Ig-like domain-containing protein [Chloroflexi bacterium]|nr:Ig-like domain-containing protein [Chloroflexota bacterium]